MSQAAYRDFVDVQPGDTTGFRDDLDDADAFGSGNRFVRLQSESFTSGPEGIQFQGQRRNDSVGFSAAVLKSIARNEYTIAIRSTGPTSLTSALDAKLLGITLRGRAGNQLSRANRFYKKLFTPRAQRAQYSAAHVNRRADIAAQSEGEEVGGVTRTLEQWAGEVVWA